MSGSHDSGMATASSTAAPKLRLPSGSVTGVPPRNTTTHSTIERMNSAAMAILLTQPRFLMPTAIHTTMSPPMTRHHTHLPMPSTVFVASAPS